MPFPPGWSGSRTGPSHCGQRKPIEGGGAWQAIFTTGDTGECLGQAAIGDPPLLWWLRSPMTKPRLPKRVEGPPPASLPPNRPVSPVVNHLSGDHPPGLGTRAVASRNKGERQPRSLDEAKRNPGRSELGLRILTSLHHRPRIALRFIRATGEGEHRDMLGAMVRYRRNHVAGGTYFFTVVLADRAAKTLVDHVDALRSTFRRVRREQPFGIEAMVVLPDHLHAVWRLPERDADYPGRWQAIKAGFTRTLRQRGVALARSARGEATLWQRRYWEHTIRDEVDLQHHVDYLHYNPVKHGLVEQVVEWPYSSFHSYVRRGLLSADWGGGGALSATGEFGE